MEKIINGKRYNTETAKEVALYDSEYPKNDFKYYIEKLYKKRTGEYFLYGDGNGLSPYAKRSHAMGGLEGSWNIIPLTADQAKKWYEKAFNADEYNAPMDIYEREFGLDESMDNEPKQEITLSLHKNIIEYLEDLAKSQDISEAQIVENLIKSEN